MRTVPVLFLLLQYVFGKRRKMDAQESVNLLYYKYSKCRIVKLQGLQYEDIG